MSLETDSGAGKIIAAAGQVSCELGGETLVLNSNTGTYYSLDGTGARVWKLLEAPRTLAEICDLLVAEYEVDRAACEADIREMIEHLAAEGLVEFRPA